MIDNCKRMRKPLISVLLALTVLQSGTLSVTQARPYRSPDDSTATLVSGALRRGEELRRKWNLDGAEAAFREAASLWPSNLAAALGLARIARGRMEYAHALILLQKAASEHPDSVEVLDEYGSIYLAAEEPARARRYFDSALVISTSDTAATIGLAGVDMLERDYDRATRRLRRYLEREPQSSAAHSVLARVLLENNQESDAAEEAGRALGLDPYDVEAVSVLMYVRSSERKADQSRSLARRVVSLDPFNFGARRVLSQYLDGQAGYQQKVTEQARLRYTSGRSSKHEGQLARAAIELEAALRIEPRYYRALIALADVLLRQGEYKRAAGVANAAIAIDPDGAIAHLELSCAYRGMNERARIEIGAVDFGALFYARPAPAAYALTPEIFPNYRSLTRQQQLVIDAAVGPLATFLPKLARRKARHYLLSFDQRPSELQGLAAVGDEKTFDGRYYASLRGVGGRVTVSGIEYLDQAARGGFNTIAHEFAHQVHIAAMEKSEVKKIRILYERARREGRILDYYAAANEHEYFAQGYEAFISDLKRPSAGVTARHTNHELLASDPELYQFLVALAGKSPSITGARISRDATNSVCLTRNIVACDYAGCAFPVSGSQQLRLLRTHPRVALNSAQPNGIGGIPLQECSE